jgi:hypothetical protein
MTPYRMRDWIGGLCLLACFGCAATPYQFGHFRRSQQEGDAQSVVIERGTPHKTLDRIAWVIGTPARILSLNRKINKHDISPETAEKLKPILFTPCASGAWIDARD